MLDRFRRTRDHDDVASRDGSGATLTALPVHMLPEVNQRVSVAIGEHAPVPSRVEDALDGALVLSDPSLPLEFGDHVVIAWERDDEWFSLETPVLGVDHASTLPTIRVAAGGRLARYDERRTDVRRHVELPLELRVLRARAVQPGRELKTHTTEVSRTAARFVTSAPFAPGDLLEARIRIGAGALDEVGVRLRVIRIDSVSGSWRSTVTAGFDEMLRSDRSRLMALVAAQGREAADDAPVGDGPAGSAPTLDGVGGRDEPEPLSTLDSVVDWLRRHT